ncbi:MAG: aminotransferase class I/II-fold pyridoxal phosphate-dependent enzyme [Sulfurimonas sp.]|nr:aminotransferase class I/II-fold pyridoxal phosphate-dependent enzyme [Sulfurimonas sp.]MDQ7059918.1 aminotransferase class I/II-fold pyridoxal phosphate-dependent enzyme [Sulfurimonas sp.]
MQALILAAGTGSRLGKHTKENTKCMLEINGETLIKRALNILNNIGIKKLILVVGYKKDNLINHLGTQYKNISIEYVENPIYDTTNNIYSLFLAKDKLAEDDTILLESDLLFEEKIVYDLMNDKRKSLAVVDKYQAWMDGTAVTLSENDDILGFYGKKAFRFQDVDKYYKTVNIYKFSKEFSKNIYIPFLEAYSKAMGDNEYYESVLRVVLMLEEQELKALKLKGERWYEIDDIQDKANAEIIFSKNPKEKLRLIQSRYGGYWRFPELKDFCYLVNPYFPTSKMQEEMKAYFYELLSQYPSGQETQRLLAGKMFKVEPENILVGNGASEIIRGLSTAIDGTFGLVFPTFNEYPESIGHARIIQFMPQNENFTYGVSDILELAKKCDNVLLINPDNPSGNFIPKKDLLEIVDKLQKMNKNFILDESFVDFSSKGEIETMVTQDILDKYENLIVIKSISKSYGVPGVRLGVIATSNSKIMSALEDEVTIWNINSYGEFFLQVIGKYKKDYNKGCKEIADERDRFYKEFQEIPYLKIIPSQANYFLLHVTSKFTALELTEILLDKYNIYIKDLTGKVGFEGKECVRIAVRGYSDNEFLIQKLKMLK